MGNAKVIRHADCYGEVGAYTICYSPSERRTIAELEAKGRAFAHERRLGDCIIVAHRDNIVGDHIHVHVVVKEYPMASEKQIEKMAMDIWRTDICDLDESRSLARKLVERGYRQKSEIIKKMQERLHEEVCDMPSLASADENQLLHMIDCVAKELLKAKE